MKSPRLRSWRCLCSHVVGESPAEPRAGWCHSSSGETLERVKHWHRLPGDGVDAPSLQTSRVRLRALKMSLIVVRWLDQRILKKIPSIPHHSVIPWGHGPSLGHSPTVPVLPGGDTFLHRAFQPCSLSRTELQLRAGMKHGSLVLLVLGAL